MPVIIKRTLPVFLTVFCLLAATLFTGQAVEANGGTIPTVYVNGTTGNNSWDGSSPTYISGTTGPKQTIASGIDAVTYNGTVYVASGTYNEYGLHLGQTMNLIGNGALNTIIDGGGHGLVLEVSSEPDQRNTISGFTIQNGAPSGSDSGGGIYITTAHIVTINDCAIINNIKQTATRPGVGGGICNAGGALYLNRCTVSGNTASVTGGGIYTDQTAGGDSGLVEITNCTISGNTVTNGNGGGIYSEPNAITHFLNVTITGNQANGAGSFGGGFCNTASAANFKNCIVSGNTAGNGINNNGYDAASGSGIVSQGYNIDSENSCYFTDPTDQINTDPLLGALQNNGGPTSTHAITAISPAFDSGTNTGAPATDQRGITRPQSTTCDIGAYEFQPQTSAQVATATGTGTATFNISSGSISGLSASASTACGPLAGYNFPQGYFTYTINGISPGSTVTITITLPSNILPGAVYYKCINGQWVNCTSLLGDNDGDNVLTLTITDGGLGDADGTVNGTIVDPGGPAVTIQPVRKIFESSESPFIASPAHIKVKNVWVQQQQVMANSPVLISANMVNSGDIEGTYTASLKINGQIEETKTGMVQPKTATTVTFTLSRSEPGTYFVDINGRESFFTVSDEKAEQNSSHSIALTIMIICFVTIIIIITFLFRRTRYE